MGPQLAGGAPCHGLYLDEARLAYAGGPFFVARVALSDRSLHRQGGATYRLGDHPIADQLRSLDMGDKAVQFIYAPQLQSLLYPGEKRLPRWTLVDPQGQFVESYRGDGETAVVHRLASGLGRSAEPGRSDTALVGVFVRRELGCEQRTLVECTLQDELT